MKRQRQPQDTPGETPIRTAYERYGTQEFYERFGAEYRNPHEDACRASLRAALERRPLPLTRALDLACGSGEMTLAVQEAGCTLVDGIDPYTGAAYRRRTGRDAERLSFEQIAAGALEGRSYSLIICSFALHLVPPSRLPLLTYRLAEIATALLVLSPHKRPHLHSAWGWALEDEFVLQRVRTRLYSSLLCTKDPSR